MIKLLIFTGLAFYGTEVQPDSVGTEVINGKIFIIHRVDEKETLYGISRRYGVTVSQILEYNPTADAGLEVGQILKVPYVPRSKPQPAQGNIHKVAEKETLFSISRMYNVTVDELKQWNNLADNALAVGQELVIKKSESLVTTQPMPAPPPVKSVQSMHTVASKETLFSIARQYGVSVQQLKEWNGLTTEELKIGQQLLVAQPVYNKEQPVVATVTERPVTETPQKEVTASVVDFGKPVIISEPVRSSNEIVESGLAELIEGTEANRKYLALHRTAPVGTILKVRNEMNGREVFVRVIGKLPDTALTDKLVIRISKSAYDRLGAIDPRFRVEVTFYK
ncbi:MAG: LysM peptidoglycan-binding domain-containing protein [Flammeovirgaceae bacterium]|nr:MAG: LysM peptidoglycan-binding domain-containing protein [Flammeovirgaceae bacterium]